MARDVGRADARPPLISDRNPIIGFHRPMCAVAIIRQFSDEGTLTEIVADTRCGEYPLERRVAMAQLRLSHRGRRHSHLINCYELSYGSSSCDDRCLLGWLNWRGYLLPGCRG